MASRSSFGFGMEFTLGKRAAPQQRPDPESPFCVAILGDFTARASRGLLETGAKLAGRKVMKVDIDNLEQTMAKVGVQLNLPVQGAQASVETLSFAELADFHPDRLVDRIAPLKKLLQLRKRLGDPATFADAAAEVQSLAGQAPAEPEPPAEAPAAGGQQPGAGGSDFERLMGGAVAAPAGSRRPAAGIVDIGKLIRDLVAPYVVPDADPRQAGFLAYVDEALSVGLRSVLHHGDFQAIEALWRGLHFLVSRVETECEPPLKICFIDVTKAELAADLGSSNDPEGTALHKLLVERTVHTPGADRWTLLVGCYTFDQTLEDVALLARLGTIASLAGAPLLSGAGASLIGCESLAKTPRVEDWTQVPPAEARKAWAALRTAPQAAYLGLALPRFLLRMPYGKETDPIEAFAFEELPSDDAHEAYLWGSPALAAAYLLAGAFSASGWDLSDALSTEVDSLPMHVRQRDGERYVQPCAEVQLTDRAVEAIIDRGLMPLVSYQGRDVARMPRFQSISDPPGPLAGRWG